MKKIKYSIFLLCTVFLNFCLTSCDDYLDDVPKGEKIPTTLADFEALMRYEYGCQRVDVTQALILLNDQYVSDSYLAFYPLYKANYLWDETANRINLNNSDEGTYYNGYSAISTFNLIIENALTSEEATEAEQKEVWAQAKVLRAMTYFTLVNFYADTYNPSDAATKLSVPLITSANINAAYEQVSIQKIYDFMLKDMEEALPFLPKESATILHPNLGTGYAFYARLYLQMKNYDSALTYAQKALDENHTLFDWTTYYESNKSIIEDPESYTLTTSPMGYDYSENYIFRHGSNYYSSSENYLLPERADRFEAGDARFLSRWKLRTVGSSVYYYSTLSGYFNYGGITTTEVFLIKAECLARSGQINEAMDILNEVRKKRILSDVYNDLTASTEAEAMHAILKTKNNELVMTHIPFCDARRLNKEGVYTTSYSKEYNGKTYSLSPTSHLWTMPFPLGAIENPGNGSITQNVEH
jgi:tetratricopeptide (TPR) repeat protein